MTGDGRHTTLNLLLWVMVFCGFNDLSWPFWGIPISGKKKSWDITSLSIWINKLNNSFTWEVWPVRP
jgi:hypothetical protein